MSGFVWNSFWKMIIGGKRNEGIGLWVDVRDGRFFTQISGRKRVWGLKYTLWVCGFNVTFN